MTKAELEERIQTAIGFLICQDVLLKSESETIRARHNQKKKGKGSNGNDKPSVLQRVQIERN